MALVWPVLWPWVLKVSEGETRRTLSLTHLCRLFLLGINMGTRFMCTVESPIHQKIKEAIVAGDEYQTSLVFTPFRNTSRIYKNSVAVEVNKREKNPDVKFEDIRDLVSGARGRQVYTTGDPEYGVWTAGQVMGLINDIPTCQDLCTRIVADAEAIITSRLNSMVVAKAHL
jgi:nitronate monooxygenase